MPSKESIKNLNPEFIFGFEVELAVIGFALKDLKAFIKNLYNGKADVGDDGSIEGYELEEYWSERQDRNYQKDYGNTYVETIEIRTPALGAVEAQAKLFELFNHLRVLKKKKHIAIDDSCGFHVNVSEKNVFTSLKENEIEFLAFWFSKKLNVEKWRKRFYRQHSEYCHWYGKPKDLEQMRDTLKDHYSAINIENIYTRPNLRRIEVRLAGNTNYHTNRSMKGFLKHVYESLEYAHTQFQIRDIKKYNGDDEEDDYKWW